MAQFELTEIGLLVLSQLTKPVHGYDIMKTIEEDFKGEVIIGPATLYTTLSKLVGLGFCQYKHVSNKKVYELTALGLQVLTNELEKKERVLTYIKKRMDSR